MKSGRKLALISVIVLITCGLGTGGICTGSRLFSEHAAGRFARWSPLGTPPDKAVRIVSLNPNWGERTVEVEIETTLGKCYRYAAGQNRWIEVNISQSEQYTGVGSCERIPPAAFSSHSGTLPSRPVNCATMIWNWELFADEVHFVVLEDGYVWWWRHYTGFDRLAMFLCGGSGIGICLGLLFSAILWRLRSNWE